MGFVDKLHLDDYYINLDIPYGHGHQIAVALKAIHGITQGHSGVRKSIGTGMSLTVFIRVQGTSHLGAAFDHIRHVE